MQLSFFNADQRSMASSRTPFLPNARQINPTDGAALSRFTETLASAFENTSITRSFSAEMTRNAGSPDPASIGRAQLLQYIRTSIREAAAGGAMLIESLETSAVAVWEFEDGDKSLSGSFIISEAGPLRREYMEKVRAAKRMRIGIVDTTRQIRPHYTLEFLGRDPGVRKIPGAISAVVCPFLERARSDNVAVWLEATSLHARGVYEHFGFRVVETIVVGAGERDVNGSFEEHGPGVPVWGMVFDGSL